jgi:serine protease Do
MKNKVMIVLLSIASIFFTSSILAAQLPDFATLVEKVSPAVVKISVVQKSNNVTPQQLSQLYGPRGEELPEVFKQFLEQMQPIPRERDAMGSGFIISADGYVLTNNHVVNKADKITVRLSDQRELSAKLIGADERSDLALLKINANNLPTVSIGNSDNLRVGDWVLAIGSPFGFDYSATQGIVSAKGRSLPRDNYVSFIQTDVAINPGNSGGPLFNLNGEVVGINSQIFSPSGGSVGLSFAIPIKGAMHVVEQLKNTGHVSRGWLGVSIQEVDKELAESFSLPTPKGALVVEVLPDSPAEKAGVQVGDIIVAVNDTSINTSSDLPQLVGSLPIGNQATLKLVRNKNEKNLALTVGSLPNQNQSTKLSKIDKKNNQNPLGVDVTNSQRGGVLITNLDVNAPGAVAGLEEGDVITTLNNEAIGNTSQFYAVANKLPKNKAVSIRVIRGERPIFLAIKIE